MNINPLQHKFKFISYRPQRYKELTGPLRGNIEKACKLIQAEARENVSQSGSKHPQILSGALRKGILYNVWQGGQTIRGYVGITKELFYGRMLEFGTIHIPPYPWLYSALKAKQNEIQRLLKSR